MVGSALASIQSVVETVKKLASKQCVVTHHIDNLECCRDRPVFVSMKLYKAC